MNDSTAATDACSDASLRRRAIIALLLISPAMSIGVLFNMVLTPGIIGNVIYSFEKVWMAVLPVAWLVWVERRRLSWSPPRQGGLIVGLVTGVLIAGVIFAAYFVIGDEAMNAPRIQEVAQARGLDNIWLYLALCLYIVTLNSLLEEYVFRWFITEKCEQAMVGLPGRWRGPLAVLGSAFIFTVHHIIALAVQSSMLVTILGSIGVFLGGVIWSGLYMRYRSVWPCYLGHAVVDVPIFVIGWWVIF